MSTTTRFFCLAALCIVSSAIYAPLTAEAKHPVVVGFDRFYSGEEPIDNRGGDLLLSEFNCRACHADDAAKALSDKQGPVLSAVGQRAKPDWIQQFLADPQKTKPGTTMPHMFAGATDEQKQLQVAALTHYLISLSNGATPPQMLAAIGARKRGEDAYHKVGCVACHGAKKPGASAAEFAVPLPELGKKYTLTSLSEFIRNPLHVRPAGRMPSLNLSRSEANDIAAFLLPEVPEKAGISYRYYEGSWANLPDFSKLTPKKTGGAEKIDVSLKQRDDNYGLQFEGAVMIDVEGDYKFFVGSDDGCFLFVDGKKIIDNDGTHPVVRKDATIRLTKGRHIVRVDYFEAGGGDELYVDWQGPGFKKQPLAPSIVASGDAAELTKIEFTLDKELAAQGAKLFTSKGCAACHTAEQAGQRIASSLQAPALKKLDTMKGCLSESPSSPSPHYNLSAVQRKQLQSAVAATKPLDEQQQIRTTFAAMNCYACHQRDEVGGVLDDRKAFFQTTEPEMGDEARIPPLLTGVGDKITPQWLDHIFADGAKDRPYMHTRMPAFGKANAGHLTPLLAKADYVEPMKPFDLEEKQAKKHGWKIVGDKGFGCIKCHTFGRYKATGVQAIDLTITTKRLREDWFKRYVRNPIVYRPGTRMPQAWPPGELNKSPLLDIYEGHSDKQVQAVWMYLTDGTRARTPAGLFTNSMELIPSYEAIIYRNFIQGAGPRAIGVGYPEQMSIAFDANDLRLALAWKGAFIDAKKHWTGRGQGFQGPAGVEVLQLPAGVPVAQLKDMNTAWPQESGRESNWKFSGYKLTEDQRPTFLYKNDTISVEDFPNPVEDGARTHLSRKIDVTGAPAGTYYRAAVGKVTQDESGWYDAGAYKLKVTGSKPVIRQAGGKDELLIPVGGGKKSIELTYQW